MFLAQEFQEMPQRQEKYWDSLIGQGDKYKVWNNWAGGEPTKGNLNMSQQIHLAAKPESSYRLYKWGCAM